MQPFSDPIFIHSSINLSRRLLFQAERILHDLIGHCNDFRIRLVPALEGDDFCEFRCKINIGRFENVTRQWTSAAVARSSEDGGARGRGFSKEAAPLTGQSIDITELPKNDLGDIHSLSVSEDGGN